LRGDSRIECGAAPDEIRPVNIANVISPVPTNPISMDVSTFCQMWSQLSRTRVQTLRRPVAGLDTELLGVCAGASSSLVRGHMAGTCDDVSRPACGSLAGASACS